MVEITLANTLEDLQGILKLQQLNHYSNLSKEEKDEQGYVTCIHSLSQLQKMNNFAKSIIVKDQNKVVGYNLAMTRDCQFDLPILVPMFEQINKLSYKEKALVDVNYIICGQVCIAKDHRGKGLFEKMYKFYAQTHAQDYPFIITEIASDNLRSIRAHKRVGFEPLKSYKDPSETNWEIVIWNFN